MDQWLDSNEKWFKQYDPELPSEIKDRVMSYRLETFGIVGFNREIYKAKYLEHKDSVLTFFKDKQLTTINICEKINLDQLWVITGKKLGHIPQLNKTI